MGKYLTAVIRWIKLLPFGGGKEKKRKQDLKKLYTQIRSIDYSFYHPYTDVVDKGFIEKYFLIYNLCSILRKVLEETIFSPDKDKAENCIHQLINNEVKKQNIDFTSYGYSSLVNRLKDTQNPEQDLTDLDNSLEETIKILGTKTGRDFQRAFNEIYLLEDFCAFNAPAFFAKFDTDYSAHPSRPVFQNAAGDEIKLDFLDLYYVAGDLEFSAAMEELVMILADMTEYDDNQKNNLKESFAKLSNLTATYCNPKILKDIVRAMQNDPYFEPEYERMDKHPLEDFADRLKATYGEAKNRFREFYKEEKTQAKIRSLFGVAPLAEILGYNDGKSKVLESKGLLPLTNILPLKMLKSYALAFYTKSLKPIIGTLLISGNFIIERNKTDLSEIYNACNNVEKEIFKFEDFLNGGGPDSMDMLMEAVRELDTDLKRPSIVNKQIKDLNRKAAFLLQMNSRNFSRLYTKMSYILIDSKMKSPEIIVNIRTIAATAGNSFYADLSQEVKNLELFISLISEYVVVEEKV